MTRDTARELLIHAAVPSSAEQFSHTERLAQDFVARHASRPPATGCKTAGGLASIPSDLARAGGQVGWQLCKSRSGNRMSA